MRPTLCAAHDGVAPCQRAARPQCPGWSCCKPCCCCCLYHPARQVFEEYDKMDCEARAWLRDLVAHAHDADAQRGGGHGLSRWAR